MAESKTMEATTQETVKKTLSKFTKEQLLTSSIFKNRKDLVIALLCEDKEYTIDEVKKMMENFMKRKVK